MKINAIAIDDEPLAIDIIEDYCEKTTFVNLQKTFCSAIEALKYLQENSVDLIFLDIQMPDLNGIDFLKILNNKPFIIFTTAYDNYALQGYELNGIDYLLKPFAFERFFQAVTKTLNIIENQHKTEAPEIINLTKTDKEYFFVKSEHKIVKIDFCSIIAIEGLKDYLKIVTTKGNILTLMSFKNIEEILPDKLFCRVHRSYIISINKIDTIEKNRIYIDDMIIPISYSYKDIFYSRIDL